MFLANKKWAVISLVFAGLFLITARSHAQCWMWGSSGGWSGPMIPEKYRLTDDQQRKIDEIHTKYDDEILPFNRQLHSKRLALNAYASRPDARAEKIKAYRKQIRDLQGKIDDLRVDAQAEVAKVLTKEQRNYFGNTYAFWATGHGWQQECPMMRGHGRWGYGPKGMGHMGGSPMESHYGMDHSSWW